jgi:two-component system, NarL family, sensor kinase
VQDLVGVSFALAAQAETMNGHGDRAAGAALTEGAAKTRDSVRALRSLLVHIYPPSLHRAGLAAALGDLATTHSARGLRTRVTTTEDLHLDDRTEQLLFRCAQEALRNTQKHADARTASITLRTANDGVVLEIVDDGRGVDADVMAERHREGHIGLRALADLVRDAGGRFDVSSADGTGTTVRVELPR